MPELYAIVAFHWWQLATSAFLHAGLLHIALNCSATEFGERNRLVHLRLHGSLLDANHFFVAPLLGPANGCWAPR